MQSSSVCSLPERNSVACSAGVLLTPKQVVGRLCASCKLRLLVPVLLPLALAAVPVGMVLVVAFLVVVPPFVLIGQGMLAYAWTFNKARSTSEPLLL